MVGKKKDVLKTCTGLPYKVYNSVPILATVPYDRVYRPRLNRELQLEAINNPVRDRHYRFESAMGEGRRSIDGNPLVDGRRGRVKGQERAERSVGRKGKPLLLLV